MAIAANCFFSQRAALLLSSLLLLALLALRIWRQLPQHRSRPAGAVARGLVPLDGEVSLMISVIAGDAGRIHDRVPYLSSQLHSDFGGRRYFVVDAWRSNGTVPVVLHDAMTQMIEAGHMDSWMIVNETESFVQEHNNRWGGVPSKRFDRIGNHIYYWMPQECKTRFLLHFDLDVLLYASPGFSFPRAAMDLLRMAPERAWYVHPSYPWYHMEVAAWDPGGLVETVLPWLIWIFVPQW
jgi:hypothetical protein